MKITWTSDKVRLKTPDQNVLIKHANESLDLNLQVAKKSSLPATIFTVKIGLF